MDICMRVSIMFALRSSGTSSPGAFASLTTFNAASTAPAAFRRLWNISSMELSLRTSDLAFWSSTCAIATITLASSSMVSPIRKDAPSESPKSLQRKGIMRRSDPSSAEEDLAFNSTVPFFLPVAEEESAASSPPAAFVLVPSPKLARAGTRSSFDDDSSFFSSEAPAPEALGAGTAVLSPRKPFTSPRYLTASVMIASWETTVRVGSRVITAVRRHSVSWSSSALTWLSFPLMIQGRSSVSKSISGVVFGCGAVGKKDDGTKGIDGIAFPEGIEGTEPRAAMMGLVSV
mmetsp:Transcript_45561/g.62107  ORF Transcript_45561/g.62107 Transcript_45561/m.62107 type:complete len:289 (-) Transcript_45561:22-888(-)